MDYGKEVDAYTEYALYAVAVKSPAAGMVDLIGALEAQNPKSKYLDDGYALLSGRARTDRGNR